MKDNKDKEINIPLGEYQELLRQQKLLKKEIKQLRESPAHRLGAVLIDGLRSWRSALGLPKQILILYKELRHKRSNANIYNNQLFRAPKRVGLASPKYDIEQKDLVAIQEEFKKRDERASLKIAAIMDDFSYSCFGEDADILQLSPETAIKEMEDFVPDFLFIESAWLGKNKLWDKKVSNCSQEVVDCIDWCYENRIPTVFWNKEDPLHFNTFLPIIRHIDYVFTTDLDSIAKYKQELGHDRVFVLPFAAQPKHHNPVEKYNRKDLFCFAGSYYSRFPERKVDLKRLLHISESLRGIEIYDRNFKSSHPHYSFPEQFKKYILGSLAVDEIDKAYKGYKYGVNINTIKQSQSMFARRVFELLASNTITISNYSRGLRTLFGDLVIASDDPATLIKQFRGVSENEIQYKKQRLLGLRKVLSQHTYKHRLNYISSKLSGIDYKENYEAVHVFAKGNTAEEIEKIIQSISHQRYPNIKVWMLSPIALNNTGDVNVSYYEEVDEWLQAYSQLPAKEPRTFFSSKYYYGQNYIVDLIHAKAYVDADVITKNSYYKYIKGEFSLQNSGNEYKFSKKANLFSSLLTNEKLSAIAISELLSSEGYLSSDSCKIFSIDSFNFCDTSESTPDSFKFVDDLFGLDTGLEEVTRLDCVSSLNTHFVNNKVSDGTIVELKPNVLVERLTEEHSDIKLTIKDESLNIDVLSSGGESTLSFDKYFGLEELNLIDNNQYFIEANQLFDGAYSVFSFFDENKKFISDSKAPIDGSFQALDIPADARLVKIGFAFKRAGSLVINKWLFGEIFDVPSTVLGKSNCLVITPQYPAYDNLYRFGFVHSRLKAYKQEGVFPDVFRLTDVASKPFREFEGVDVVEGNLELLNETLSSGQYTTLLIHYLEPSVWPTISKYLDKMNVIIWTHGGDIQYWKRRAFQFSDRTAIERLALKNSGETTKKFWSKLLNDPPRNLKVIFVSEYFKDEVFSDYDVHSSSEYAEIIHNYISSDDFPYNPKNIADRKKVLSIRPYTSPIYANDLTVKAILELSGRSCFAELDFCLVGEGPQFDKITAPLQKFNNVKLIKKFLSHTEIADLHRDYGIFLTPTRMDTQGVSRGEAMASGLVPITTNIAAIPEFVDDQTGILVEPEDAVGLANAIERLYNNPELFLTLSKNASDRVRQQCGYEKTISKELEIIKSDIQTK